MENYLSAGSSFIRRQYAPHLLLALLVLLMSGFFISYRNLDAGQAAKVMEVYAAFGGILLLTPLFLPEQNREIWLLKRSKAMPLWKLYLLRLLLAMMLLAAWVTLFLVRMQQGGSQFAWGKLWVGSFSEILFLGAIGFFVSGITNQVVLGYMASVIYFIANIGAAKHLGKFALFQMMKGSYEFAAVMMGATAVLGAGAILLREKAGR